MTVASIKTALRHRFSLTEDKADDAEIEKRLRSGVELVGDTPWILIFAIFIASVGLNVNSTAVIIGAMLISPLMGPIMGAGLGAAIYDFDLVKRALLNLGIATLISLVVSAIYFSLSPLQEAQSELLARTTPTIWDVLIALFGGLAGIIGLSRQKMSNVIPGVAIATALMPPICTAGFGLATGKWSFVGGALYLYTINCVFIALATIIGIRILGIQSHAFTDHRIEVRVKYTLWFLALLTALPSIYLAATLVNEELFNAKARKFIEHEFTMYDNTHVADSKIDPKQKSIELTLIGSILSPSNLQAIQNHLPAAGLDDTKMIFHQSNDNHIDVTALKSSLLSDLYQDSQEAIRKRDAEIANLNEQLASRQALFVAAADIDKELRAEHPLVDQVFISEGLYFDRQGEQKKLLNLSVLSTRPLPLAERNRIINWYKVRSKSDDVLVNFNRTLK